MRPSTPPDVTHEHTSGHAAREVEQRPVPGLLVLFTSGEPALVVAPFPRPGPHVLGRGDVLGIPIDDATISRRHAELEIGPAGVRVRDLGSRNGTFVDGEALKGEARGAIRVLRLGDTILSPREDLRPYLGKRVEVREQAVVGPVLGVALDEVARAAGAGDVLHIAGESGTGKELAARWFHGAGRRRAGNFVAVNCAAIPGQLAERLIFGARRGAYSGADKDADGYLQSAHGGTLFLDEVAELDPGVQAKLLRALEEREVMPLGASKPVPVDFAFCSATHGDLRARAGAGKFREDLYYRIGRPSVRLPPLRERFEDIPHLAARQLAQGNVPRMHVRLVEELLLRPWPGNVRELLLEVKHAAHAASAAGANRVEAEHLPPEAGRALAPEAPQVTPREPPASNSEREQVLEALRRARGNVSAASRALGWHRTQLRRFLEREGIDPDALG